MDTRTGAVGLTRLDLVEYLILAVPDVTSLSAVVGPLRDLVLAGQIHIFDLVVLVRDREGAVDVLELESVASIAGLREVDGEVGGLLSAHDIELASLAIRPDSAGLVLVMEDRWAHALAEAAGRAGGCVVAGERIPASRVETVRADQRGDGERRP